MKGAGLFAVALALLSGCAPATGGFAVPSATESATDAPTVEPTSCGCPLPHSAPLVYGPDVTLTTAAHTVRLQAGDVQATVHLPLAASVQGQRWTVKMWGSDANAATFLPAVDPETGLMDGMSDIDGDSLLETAGGNPAIVIEAFGDTDGPVDGPGPAGGPDAPGWMVLSRSPD